MKTILLFSTAIAAATAFAQPTIQSSDFTPTVGETFLLNYGTYVSEGNPGANQTWDLSSASNMQQITVNVKTANNQYPGSNRELEYVGSSSLHANFSANAYEIVGESANGVSTVFTNPKKLYQFPMTMGTNFTDNFTADVSTSGVVLSRTGTVTSTVDGYGTLITPAGTFTNVLRVKSIHLSTDSYMGQSMNASFEIYSFIKAGTHFELAAVTIYDTGAQQGENVYYVDGSTLSLLEKPDKLNAVIYPNPANEHLILSTDEIIDQICIRDLNGREIKTLSNQSLEQVDVSELASGVYYITITAQEASSTQKFVKQ